MSIETTNKVFEETDRIAIEQAVRHSIEAWNRHSVKDFAAFFYDDADLVTLLCKHVSGKAEIEKILEKILTGIYHKNSIQILNIKIREIQPNTAIAIINWEMTDQEKKKSRQGILTQLYTRLSGNQWKIAYLQNTPEPE